jgi:hypothetical protein
LHSAIDADQRESDWMEAVRNRVETSPSDLDRFVSEQNVARYRKLLDASTDEMQRRAIIQLLADQMAKLRNA